jgi:hypothetical protein
MVQLATNQPFRSREPQITVENPLKPGSYRFSLVVVDEAHNESQPAELTVTVVERTRPVLRPEILRATETIRDPIIKPLRVPR